MDHYWSQFSHDLLALIVNKLHAFDAVRFGAVCVQWNIVFKHRKACGPFAIPLVMMVPKKQPPTNAMFYSITEKKCFTVSIPEPKIKDRQFCGSSYGWIITIVDCEKLHLLQPLTSAQIPLPDFTTMPFFSVVRDTCGCIKSFKFTVQDREKGEMHDEFLLESMNYFFSNATLSESPSSSKNYIVMMTVDYGKHLVFARAGDKSWSVVDNPCERICNMIVHKGKFHSLCWDGMLLAWDWDSANLTFKPRVVAPKFYKYNTPEFVQFNNENPHFFSDKDIKYLHTLFADSYLLESANGEQLMVLVQNQGFAYKLLCWSEKMHKWTHLKSLCNQVLFLSNSGKSMCLPATMVPELRPNCIYLDRGTAQVYASDTNKKREYTYYNPRHFSDTMNSFLWLTPSLI